MKIIGRKSSSAYPTYIVELDHSELDKIVHEHGKGHDLHHLEAGTMIDVSALWNRAHALERAIASAGDTAARNLRALADMTEQQVRAITPPEDDEVAES